MRGTREREELTQAVAALGTPAPLGVALDRVLGVLVPARARVAGIAVRDAEGRWRTRGFRCAGDVDAAAAQACVDRLAQRPPETGATQPVRPSQLAGDAAEAWRRAGLRSGLVAPLRTPAAPIGSLVLAGGGRVRRADARFAEALAQHLVLRVSHALLVEQTESVLRRAAVARADGHAGLADAREILRSAPHPVAVLRAERAGEPVYEDVNEAFCALAGEQRQALLHRRATWVLDAMAARAVPEELLRLRLGRLDLLEAATPDGVVRVVRLRTVGGVRRLVVHVLDGVPGTHEPEPGLLVGARHVHPEAAEIATAMAVERGHHVVVGVVRGPPGPAWAREAAERARDRLQPADVVTWLADGRLMCVVVDHLLHDAQRRFDAFTQGARPAAVGYADTATPVDAATLLGRARA